MTSQQQKCLSADRVRGPPSINVSHLECAVCRDVLWKPVACQLCETPFCLACINRWLIDNPKKCPNRCDSYKERKCPPFIAKLLAELQVSCSYEEKGCKEVISYEALDKHETDCNFAPQQCPGCKSQILKKNFEDHKNSCALFELICPECKLVYKRGNADTKHTENICLREQLRQMREESKKNKLEMQDLSRQLTELRSINPVLKQVSITFADLPSPNEKNRPIPVIYKGLKWSTICYGHELHLKKRHPKSGYATCFMPGGSPHIAFFKDEATIRAEDATETFTMISLNACAAWFDNMQLIITGYRKSAQINTHTSKLLFGKPQLILLEWSDIDKVTFKQFGGTMHPEIGATVTSTQVVITQLKIS